MQYSAGQNPAFFFAKSQLLAKNKIALFIDY